jgi:hypothetical protein
METKTLEMSATMEQAQEVSAEMLNDLAKVLDQLHDNEWQLFKQPIVLEFSQEDLDDTKNQQTPSALVRRILRARKELGFPEEILDQLSE